MDQHGWIVTCVPELKLCYSVGLMAKFGHPEIMIHGLKFELGFGLIHDAVKLIVKGSKFHEDGIDYMGIAAGLPAQFIVVHESNHHDWLGMAVRYYSPNPIEALQLVWCDTKGKFPWQDGFEVKFLDKQLLFDGRQPYGPSHFEQKCECEICEAMKQELRTMEKKINKRTIN